jgi:TPR repeat protein
VLVPGGHQDLRGLAAATAGDQVSMTKLGSLYEAGSGVRKDYA